MRAVETVLPGRPGWDLFRPERGIEPPSLRRTTKKMLKAALLQGTFNLGLFTILISAQKDAKLLTSEETSKVPSFRSSYDFLRGNV